MPSKKKPSKKKKAARAVRPQPKLDSQPVSPPETEATLQAQAGKHWQLRPEILILLVIVLLALATLGALGYLQKNRVTPVSTSSISDDTPSTLQVVGGEDGGSTGSASLLQPQPSGLQQVPTMRQSEGANLQAPNTPEITPQTLPD